MKYRFNYLSLYNEVCNQKKGSYMETTHLTIYQIKCPYCRSITNKLLPYIEHNDVTYKKGVNYPTKYCMSLYKCEWNIRTGKNKNNLCGKSAYKTEHGTYCLNHNNKCINKVTNEIKIKGLESRWTKEHEQLYKKYTVLQLRELIRHYKNKSPSKNVILGGNKKELIDRIIVSGLSIDTMAPDVPLTSLTNTIVDI